MLQRRLSAEQHESQVPLKHSPDHDDDDDYDDTADLDHLSDELNVLDDDLAPKRGMSVQEKRNVFFLFGLYLIHAIPLAFSWTTMPVLLREKLSYSQVGTFLVSQYPYSIKVVWSPIVEALHVPGVGRRKSWIVPAFLVLAVAVLWLGMAQDRLVIRIADGESFAMFQLVVTWLLVMVACSCIRIALDSWSLDLLSQENVHWASTAVSVGESMASFISFNLFLGLSSYGSTSSATTTTTTEAASTHFFYIFWAAVFVGLAMCLFLFNRETDLHAKNRSIAASYKVILGILSIRPIWTLFGVHMVSMIGFQTNDAIATLQLVKYNFSDRDLALLATLVFPFEAASGIFIAKLFSKHHPLKVWRRLFPGRLLTACITQLAILFIAKYRDSPYRFWIALPPAILSKVFETTMFVALVAFHVQISDPKHGGIYIPLLATTLNLRYDLLGFVYTKTIGLLDGSEDLTKPTTLIDGYQIVNFVTVALAVPVFIWYMRPVTKKLQTIDPLEFRVSSSKAVAPQEYRMVNMRDNGEAAS